MVISAAHRENYWILSLFYFDFLRQGSHLFFNPSKPLKILGWGLIISGGIAVLASIVTLGMKRFFLWAVLNPDSIATPRIKRGPFAFVPHPAYLGQILIMLGNALSSGQGYVCGAFLFLLAAFPIVIVLEELELKERLAS